MAGVMVHTAAFSGLALESLQRCWGTLGGAGDEHLLCAQALQPKLISWPGTEGSFSL